MLKTTVRRLLKQPPESPEGVIRVQICCAHDERERVLGLPWKWPLFGQLVGIWRGHNKDTITSLDGTDMPEAH